MVWSWFTWFRMDSGRFEGTSHGFRVKLALVREVVSVLFRVVGLVWWFV